MFVTDKKIFGVYGLTTNIGRKSLFSFECGTTYKPQINRHCPYITIWKDTDVANLRRSTLLPREQMFLHIWFKDSTETYQFWLKLSASIEPLDKLSEQQLLDYVFAASSEMSIEYKQNMENLIAELL